MARSKTKTIRRTKKKKPPARAKAKAGERRGAVEAIERVISGVRSGVKNGVKKVRELVGLEELGAFSREAFMDQLSEFLEHERGGAVLYELGLDKEGIFFEQQDWFREFAE